MCVRGGVTQLGGVLQSQALSMAECCLLVLMVVVRLEVDKDFVISTSRTVSSILLQLSRVCVAHTHTHLKFCRTSFFTI